MGHPLREYLAQRQHQTQQAEEQTEEQAEEQAKRQAAINREMREQYDLYLQQQLQNCQQQHQSLETRRAELDARARARKLDK